MLRPPLCNMRARSLRGRMHPYCKSATVVHFSVLFRCVVPTMRLKRTESRPRRATFSLRVFLPRRLLAAYCMRTLANPLKHINRFEVFLYSRKAHYVPNNAMQFLGNYSGHFARLTYGYVHCLIFHGASRNCDSQTELIKYTPLSAFSCNMRARVAIAGQKPVIFTHLTAFKSLTSKNTIPWTR